MPLKCNAVWIKSPDENMVNEMFSKRVFICEKVVRTCQFPGINKTRARAKSESTETCQR